MARIIYEGDDMRDRLIKGINKLTKVIGHTIGPVGHNVLLNNNGGVPSVTNDGITVAQAFSLPDEVENLGVTIIRTVSARTAELAGDGTSTSCVLANSMLNQGKKLFRKSLFGGITDRKALKKGMDLAVDNINRLLERYAKKIESYEDVCNVATVSSNNDDFVGKLVADAYEKIGLDGVLSVDRVNHDGTYVQINEGYKIDKGYSDSVFINDKDKQTVNYSNGVFVLICPNKLSISKDFIKLLENIIKENKSLLIICDEPDTSVKAALLQNKISSCIVSCPGVQSFKQEIIEDITVFIGGIPSFDGNTIGYCGGFKSELTKTMLFGPGNSKENIDERVEILRSRLDDKKGTFHDSVLKDRMGALNGKMAVLFVGAKTSIERGELYDRIDDATRAVISSMDMGIVAGAGYTYFKLFEDMECREGDADVRKGFEIVRKSLMEPLKCICDNANYPFGEVLKQMRKGLVFDAKTSCFNDQKSNRIYDPAKVIKVSVENAVSVTSTVLLANHLLY